MQKNASATHNCPIAGLLDIAGDRWAFLILRDAFYGVRRFDAFRQHLGISRKILSARLGHMVAAGLFAKIRYQERPERFEYALTGMGRDLFPTLLTMIRWGNRWLGTADKPSLALLHTGCKQITEPSLVCHHCGDTLTPANVRPLAGPGAAPEAVRALQTAIRKSGRRRRLPHE